MRKQVSLKKYCSWNVGGCAEFFLEPESLKELKEAQLFSKKNNLNLTILGRGTNSLISDKGIKGLVVCTRKLVGIKESVTDRMVLECLAGTPKILLKKKFLDFRLAPALFLSGIPGDVAGGVIMNAGVSEEITPREFGEIVDWVEILKDGNFLKIPGSKIDWQYRSSFNLQSEIISRVCVSWEMDKIDNLEKKVLAATKNRLSKQPLDQKSCGSVFVNPKGNKAARLIEECKLKGFKHGQAMVSKKHANFIVNLGGATASDIDKIIKHIQHTVFTKAKIKLKTEVKYLGTWPN